MEKGLESESGPETETYIEYRTEDLYIVITLHYFYYYQKVEKLCTYNL